MTFQQRTFINLGSLLIVCFCWLDAYSQSTNESKYLEISTAIINSYQYRNELLKHSTGKANFKLIKSFNKGARKTFEEKLKKEGYDPSKFITDGENEWQLTYYKDDKRIRYDFDPFEKKDQKVKEQKAVESASGQEKNIYPIPQSVRVVNNYEENTSIYYIKNLNEGYLNKPPRIDKTPTGFSRAFDIEFLYEAHGGSFQEVFDAWRKDKDIPLIHEETINNIPCITLENRYDYEGSLRKSLLSFAPAMGYVCIKNSYQVYEGSNESSPLLDEVVFNMDYFESKSHPGMWLLSNYEFIYRMSPYNEKLTATFEYCELDKRFDEKVFSWDGLGIPKGAPVYDKRLGGNSLVYYYDSGLVPDMQSFKINNSGIRKIAKVDFRSIPVATSHALNQASAGKDEPVITKMAGQEKNNGVALTVIGSMVFLGIVGLSWLVVRYKRK